MLKLLFSLLIIFTTNCYAGQGSKTCDGIGWSYDRVGYDNCEVRYRDNARRQAALCTAVVKCNTDRAARQRLDAWVITSFIIVMSVLTGLMIYTIRRDFNNV